MSSDFKLVAVKQVPVIPRKENYGRAGRIFALLLDSPGKAVAIDVKTKSEGRSLHKSLRKIADDENRDLEWSRTTDWSTFYFWVVEAA